VKLVNQNKRSKAFKLVKKHLYAIGSQESPAYVRSLDKEKIEPKNKCEIYVMWPSQIQSDGS
jgi:hypothetical protein